MRNNDDLIKISQQTWLQEHEAELIRAELNLCKLNSIWDTSKSKRKSKIIEQREVLPDGSIKIKRISVGKVGKNEAGIFTIKKHLKTILALLKISAGQNNPETCQFGVHQLAEILNLQWSGRTYKFFKEALLDLGSITITFENIFYNKQTNQTEEVIAPFHWLDDLKLYGRLKNGQPNLAISTFSLNKYVRQNILKDYTKPLFLTTIAGFKTEIAILLYNHLDLIMADKDHYERNLKNLIEVDFRLDGNYPTSAWRKKLFLKPLKELKGVKLSTGILTDIKLEKTKDGKDYKIVCKKSLPLGVIAQKQKQGKPPAIDSGQAQDLVIYFHARLNPKVQYQPTAKEIQQAQDLLAQYGEEKVKYIISYAIKQAKKTSFKMQFFGAILGYTEDALTSLNQEEEHEKERQAQQEAKAKEYQLEEDYKNYIRDLVENYKNSISKEEYQTQIETLKTNILKKSPYMKPHHKEGVMLQNILKAQYQNWLIEQEKIEPLDFDDWLAERETTKTTSK